MIERGNNCRCPFTKAFMCEIYVKADPILYESASLRIHGCVSAPVLGHLADRRQRRL
jgi:hypothetical protein